MGTSLSSLELWLMHLSMAAAYDIPVVPHGSGPYSFQAIMAFTNSDFCEYIVSQALVVPAHLLTSPRPTRPMAKLSPPRSATYSQTKFCPSMVELT